jgi:hypothetical protein
MQANRSNEMYTLIVDAGNFSGGNGRNDLIKAKYLLKGMALLKYDAINLGERDLMSGKQYLAEIKKNYDIPFISANIYDAKSRQLFAKPFVIKRFGAKKTLGLVHGGFKMGVFGITLSQSPQMSSETDDQDFYIKDPVETAKQMIAELRGKCDIIVALCDLGIEKSEELAQSIKGIDVIISGRYSSVQYEPMVTGNTLIVQAGLLGKYFGDLSLVLNNNYQIQDHRGLLTPLNAEIPDDSLMVALLNEYRDELNIKTTSTTISVSAPPSLNHVTLALYLGAEKCIDCHKNQYSQWKNTRHATAFRTLSANRNENNPNCQKCHTTGYKDFNGFDDLGSTPDMINVQCEACHGHGFKHLYTIKNDRFLEGNIKKAVGGNQGLAQSSKLIDKFVCLKCHNSERDPDFNFEKAVKKVMH